MAMQLQRVSIEPYFGVRRRLVQQRDQPEWRSSPQEGITPGTFRIGGTPHTMKADRPSVSIDMDRVDP